MGKKILLTFDLEEFDLPEEYNIEITKSQQLDISTTGLKNLLEVLRSHRVIATFFTTAYYAQNNTALMRQIASEGHEIASHMYYHSDYDERHLSKSRQKLAEITHTKILGFRSPRLKKMNPKLIKQAGYLYDSSLNPTYLPGRYNNFSKPRGLFKDQENNLYVFPFSVATLLRFPLFWLSFKNINPTLYLFLCKQALNKDGYLHLYFHPWEFTDLSSFKIPWFIKRKSGTEMINRLDWLIGKMNKMSGKGEYTSISKWIQNRYKKTK